MKILVTGGAGFIGSAVIRHILMSTDYTVVNVDKLTYASSSITMPKALESDRYCFLKVDICDKDALKEVFRRHQPDKVLHLAAESHVDRSIESPQIFVKTNILGTFNLLEVVRSFFDSLDHNKKKDFLFHHISTDEVFGEIDCGMDAIVESNTYNPSSPYAASKASADHLVRSWGRTYKLPCIVSNSANNYGPYQFPEKLIPLTIIRALQGHSLPIYGDGSQVRDWIFVEDHARALIDVLMEGEVGETYNISASNEQKNRDVVLAVCELLEDLAPRKPEGVCRYCDLITYVSDRPGHDQRYSIDSSKIRKNLGWMPRVGFSEGLRETVQWYIDNHDLWGSVNSTHVLSRRFGE